MSDSEHGCGTTLRNNGNDGCASITEHASGRIEITVYANSQTRANVEISVLPIPGEV